ncbi:MAG: hypothetical protein JSW27_25795 [Phycisphaerales bacterium]|nr:MAG: hypothetical protein JSW27_25795 [Phycisphaerales bacterium]
MLSMAIQIAATFVRRVWVKSLLIILACNVSFALMRFLGELGYEMPAPLMVLGLFSFQLLLALTMLIIYYTSEFSPTVGFPTRMYILPAKTSLLVSAQMVSGTLAGVLIYLVTAAGAWIILGARWPLLGPSFFLAIFLAWNMAIMWCAPGLSITKAPPAMLIWGALLVWVGRRYGIDSLPMHPTKMWASVTLGELLTMTLLGASACAVAVVGVSRDRRGDSPELKRIKTWLEQEVAGQARHDRNFSSAVAAQMWFEVRTKGHLVPIANAVIQFLIAVVYLCSRPDGTEATMLIVAALIVPLGCPYFVGLLAGSCSSSGEPRQMDSFRAIRPMSTAALAHVMLRNGGLSVLLTWSGWLASFLLLAVCVNITGHGPEFFATLADSYEKIGFGRLVLVGLLVAICSWTAMASAASSAMSDRRWTPWIPRIAVIAISLLLVYFHARGLIAPTQYVTLFRTFCWTIGSWCSVTTLLAFYRARRRRLITDRAIGLATSGWVVLCLAGGHALWRLRHIILADARFPPELVPACPVAFLGAGLFMMPFAPWATAPLHLARRRSH